MQMRMIGCELKQLDESEVRLRVGLSAVMGGLMSQGGMGVCDCYTSVICTKQKMGGLRRSAEEWYRTSDEKVCNTGDYGFCNAGKRRVVTARCDKRRCRRQTMLNLTLGAMTEI